MRSIEDVYPGLLDDEGCFSYPSDYRPLVLSLMLGSIVIEIHEQGYQGDSWYLFKPYQIGEIEYRYLRLGWGSCSGCDALQSCGSYEEIEKLRQSLLKNVKEFKSKEEMVEYFSSNKREYEYDSDSGRTFRAACIAMKEEW